MLKILISSVLLFHLAICQSLEDDYKNLAKYSILKYKLENNYEIRSVLEYTLEDMSEIISNKAYRYSIKELGNIFSYKIISVVDSTNFQLHGLHETVFAIDEYETGGVRYSLLTEDVFHQFVNQNLYAQVEKSNRGSFLQFYNEMIRYFKTDYHRTVRFYREDNIEELAKTGFDKFVPEIRVSFKTQNDPVFQYYYSVEDSYGVVELYRVVYRFDYGSLNVEYQLMAKQKT